MKPLPTPDPVLKACDWRRFCISMVSLYAVAFIATLAIAVASDYFRLAQGCLFQCYVIFAFLVVGYVTMVEALKMITRYSLRSVAKELWSESRFTQAVAIMLLALLYGARFGPMPGIFQKASFDEYCNRWRKWWNCRTELDELLDKTNSEFFVDDDRNPEKEQEPG